MLCRLGRKHPDLPAALYYDEEELAVLEVYKDKLPQHARTVPAPAQGRLPPPAPCPGLSEPALSAPTKKPVPAGSVPTSTLTLFQANLLVAMLAGFWGRKSEGHPGAKLLGEGLRILSELVNFQRLTGPLPRKPP